MQMEAKKKYTAHHDGPHQGGCIIIEQGPSSVIVISALKSGLVPVLMHLRAGPGLGLVLHKRKWPKNWTRTAKNPAKNRS